MSNNLRGKGLQIGKKPATTFTSTPILHLHYQEPIKSFIDYYDANITPIDDLIINAVTDLINHGSIVIQRYQNEQQKQIYNQIYQQFNHLQQSQTVAVVPYSERIYLLKRILDENTHVHLDPLINQIIDYLCQLTDKNQLQIEPIVQFDIINDANQWIPTNLDEYLIEKEYDSRQSQWHKRDPQTIAKLWQAVKNDPTCPTAEDDPILDKYLKYL